MNDATEVREKIATEAARLMLRGKERDFAAARKRAARWLKRRKLHRDEIPSNQEIQVQLYALSGLMASERDPQRVAQQQHLVQQTFAILAPHLCIWQRDALESAAAAEIELFCVGDAVAIYQKLSAAGWEVSHFTTESPPLGTAPGNWRWTLRITAAFDLWLRGVDTAEELPVGPHLWDAARLQQTYGEAPVPEYHPADDEHPDVYAVFQMLLSGLDRVMLPRETHPEGDALYHSLQVFELGLAIRPYDEEFLLACLLHDIGWGINPQHPVLSAIDALGTLITERTRFLIEQRPVASEYLRSGQCPKSLRKHPDFEDLIELARCDRHGRVPGAQVRSLEEAFTYLEDLADEWEEDDDGDEW
jgi:hypothetical protein